mgnify:CR=1 FL=1
MRLGGACRKDAAVAKYRLDHGEATVFVIRSWGGYPEGIGFAVLGDLGVAVVGELA